MRSYHRPSFGHSFQLFLTSFVQVRGLPFAEVLSEREIQDAFDEEKVSFGQAKDAVYTPAITLWTFLSQVLCPDKSCRAAVARVVVLYAVLGRSCSSNTGDYCRTRAKISEMILRRLAIDTGRRFQAPGAMRLALERQEEGPPHRRHNAHHA